MKEQMIINKIKKGDQRALDSFIRELYPPIYSFAYRKLQGGLSTLFRTII